MPSGQVNLRTLSEMLGLSQTTVSRALNGFPEVSERTRQRVVEAANKVNYRPSPSAASLATGKSRTIGHVVPLSGHMMINPHFSDFVAGAGEEYARHDYELLIRVVPLEEEERVYRDFAYRNRVEGVVVHGPLVNDPRIGLLQALDLPFVVHGRSDGITGNYSWLDVNNRDAMYRATEFLIDLGHQNIGFINGLEAMNFAARRRQGFEAAMKRHGLAVNPSLMHSADMLEPYGYSAMQKMLELREPPSAVLVSSILPAMGAQRAISESGLSVGRDVSIIAYDDCLSFLNPVTRRGIPHFTNLRSSIREAGKRVAQILIEQINRDRNNSDREISPIQELWEAEFVVGASTGPFRG